MVAAQNAETKRQQQLALLDEAERFAKAVADRHVNQPLPDSVDIIREMRDERDDQLLGMCRR